MLSDADAVAQTQIILLCFDLILQGKHNNKNCTGSVNKGDGHFQLPRGPEAIVSPLLQVNELATARFVRTNCKPYSRAFLQGRLPPCRYPTTFALLLSNSKPHTIDAGAHGIQLSQQTVLEFSFHTPQANLIPYC